VKEPHADHDLSQQPKNQRAPQTALGELEISPS